MDAATTKPRNVTTSEGGRATSIENKTREKMYQMYGIVWEGGFSGVTTKQWVSQLQHLGMKVHQHYETAKTVLLSK
jgi:hypothetical protein